ncbi:hypothetical protein TrRE_jg13112 [Triparma retinervis]|uniref:Uncharacterized protein n=1 Tax=Triparma retinervis TaxID=2557542 RepID=A0A9W7B040_9STRA|nr:hypothetical protein TrRE_jg13112 [Triparma retinervis]
MAPLSLSLLSASSFGKGGDTINSINHFFPVKDASFWDYAVLARESGGNQLRIFGEEGKSCEEELREWGGKEEDIKYYVDDLDVFSPSCMTNVNPSTFPSAALVALTSTLKSMPGGAASSFYKIVEVRERTSSGEEEWGAADITVEALGELRALSICSYAMLTKKA